MIVTHDASAPWGCRAFNFKGNEFPARVVRQNSGEACRAYEESSTRPERPRGSRPSRPLPHRDGDGYLA